MLADHVRKSVTRTDELLCRRTLDRVTGQPRTKNPRTETSQDLRLSTASSAISV
jgi:hypothetical protein